MKKGLGYMTGPVCRCAHAPYIAKTCLHKYTENLTPKMKKKFR